MFTTIARRITSALTATAVAAGLVAGVALGTTAPATAAPTTANCTASAPAPQSGTRNPNPLTRAAQVNAIKAATAPPSVSSVSCLGH